MRADGSSLSMEKGLLTERISTRPSRLSGTRTQFVSQTCMIYYSLKYTRDMELLNALNNFFVIVLNRVLRRIFGPKTDEVTGE